MNVHLTYLNFEGWHFADFSASEAAEILLGALPSYCLKVSSNTALALALSSDCFSMALSERMEMVTASPLTGLGDTKLLDLGNYVRHGEK